jgi:predicted XRE-type DNA-binding protein
VLHPFQKKTQKAARADLDLAMQRYRIARKLTGGVKRGQESDRIEREELTQIQASKRLGITQPRVSEITRGNVARLALGYLVGLGAKSGLSVGLKVAARRGEAQVKVRTGSCRSGPYRSIRYSMSALCSMPDSAFTDQRLFSV